MQHPVGECGFELLVSPLQVIPEALPTQRDVLVVPTDEDQRNVERPLGVTSVLTALPPALLEDEGQRLAAVRVGVTPDPCSTRDEAVGLSERHAGVRIQGGHDR